MRSLHLPWVVLGTLLVLALVNGRVLEARCQYWQWQIEEMDQCVAEEDWDGAEKKLDTLRDDWQGAQMYLSVVCHHRELDEAQALVRRCGALVKERDREGLRAHLADLSDQLGYLAAAEQCSWRNIL